MAIYLGLVKQTRRVFFDVSVKTVRYAEIFEICFHNSYLILIQLTLKLQENIKLSSPIVI